MRKDRQRQLALLPLRTALLVLFFSQSYALTGTKWSDFNISKITKPSDSGIIVNLGEIALDTNSVLNLTVGANPKLDEQYFNGDLLFKGVKLFEINVDIQAADATGMTSIYKIASAKDNKGGIHGVINYFICEKLEGGEGSCSINLNVNATKAPIYRLFDVFIGTLTIDQNIKMSLTPNGSVNTIFHNAGTLEFDGGFFVDLREQNGVFTDPKIQGTRKVVIEHYGANTAINTYKKALPVQIYGDIVSAGQRLALNLMTADSFFEGHYDIGDSPHNYSYNDILITNGARANIDLTFLKASNDAPQRFTVMMSNHSNATINAIFDRTRYALLDFDISNSVLYANLSYSQASAQRGAKDTMRIALRDNGSWITNQDAYADEIYFNVQLPNQPSPTALNAPLFTPRVSLSRAGGGGVVDLRYSDFAGTLRSYNQFDETKRIVLKSRLISGNNGLFKLYGILNRNLWLKDAQGNTIATDQIITNSIIGNHYIEIHWDPRSVDESLINADLIGDRIVVARQLSTVQEGNFIGAMTPIGLYEYQVNLSKENLFDNTGAHIGYEWVIGKLAEPVYPPASRPSYLSKTLNALLAIPYKTLLSQTQTLHQRMGDLRYFDNIAGAYIKTNYSLFYGFETSQAISSYTHIEDITLGADLGVFGYGGKHFFGTSFNITPLQDIGESGAYEGSTLAYGFSVYQTSLFDNGVYTDMLLKYTYANHQYDLYTQDFAGNSLDFDSHSLLASFEIGYKFRLPIKTPHFDYSFYYLKPQFNLDFGVIFGNEGMRIQHSENYDVGINSKLAFPLTPSFSVDFGRRFDNDKILGDVFISLGAEYAFNAGNALELSTPYNDGTFSPEGIFNLKFGVGGNVMLLNGVRFYFDLSSKFVGRIAPVLSMSAGARIPIGAKHTRNTPTSLDKPIIYGR